MMERRKNPEKELQNKSGLFYSIGLLIAMMLCVSAFEYRVQSDIEEPIELMDSDEDIPIPPITIQNPPPPPPKPKKVVIIPVPDDDTPEEVIQPEVPDFDDFSHIEVPEPVDEPPMEKAPEIYAIVEEMPVPEGGLEAFYRFISKNLKYPAQARRMGLEGKVFVQFVVAESGELSDIEVIKGIGAGCDNEVLRIMKKAPRWNPGKQRGVPVRVRQVIPVDFRLGN